jgi:hypothetical protein
MDHGQYHGGDMANIDSPLRKAFDTYVEEVMSGQSCVEAALRAGIPEENIGKWVRLAETDAYVIERKAELAKQFKVEEHWNPVAAVLGLLRMANDRYEKGINRLNAMRELNVICGITIVDGDGRVRSGSSLTDFYQNVQEVEQSAPALPGPGEPRRMH